MKLALIIIAMLAVPSGVVLIGQQFKEVAQPECSNCSARKRSYLGH